MSTRRWRPSGRRAPGTGIEDRPRAGAGELRKQAEALGRYVSNPEWLDDFGLAVPEMR
jgi:hypothetical protein